MDPSIEDFNRRSDPITRAKKPSLAEVSKPLYFIPLNVTFYLFSTAHILAALYAPIQDCDETFNYWEPLHYLTHGYGLQTWEYSPEFSIRSWAYIVIHSGPSKILSLFVKSKTAEFYLTRVVLASVCAATETRLYSAISRKLNARVGVFYFIIVISSPGVFYASAAFLPSSFAMYTSTLGLTSFVDWRRGSMVASGIMWFGIGALVGWPFAGVLIIPFLLEEVVMAAITRETWETIRKFLDGAVRCLIVLVLQISIDAFFYHRVVVVPWNIVMYNVFSGKDRGPNIFGTEPWDFYARNLLLNFNIWFILGMAAAPLVACQYVLQSQLTTKQTRLRTSILITPFYIWLAIFTVQPHKEERFMFPAYPFLSLNAAVALHVVLSWIGTADPAKLMSKVPAKVKLIVILVAILGAVNIGLLRIYGTVSAYRAPLQIYEAFGKPGLAHQGDTVCFGKDWYRFPTSFFLPEGVRAKFIKSGFDGLLPGEFSEARTGFGFFPGTWLIPSGMNDRNEEDASKYVAIAHCSYLVDSHMQSSKASPLEPTYALDEGWETIKCAPFLDPVRTGLLARTIWIPDLPVVPASLKRVWGEHCLLRRASG